MGLLSLGLGIHNRGLCPRVISNHCPFLMEYGVVGRGCCAFKFENMWLKIEKVQ